MSISLLEIATVVGLAGHHESKSKNQLVFNKYGDRYFLNRILCPAYSSMNVDVAKGKAEKRARTLEASVNGATETLVAAR